MAVESAIFMRLDLVRRVRASQQTMAFSVHVTKTQLTLSEGIQTDDENALDPSNRMGFHVNPGLASFWLFENPER
jgi:hypothetical protein